MKPIIAASRGGYAFYNKRKSALFFHGFALVGGVKKIDVVCCKNGARHYLGECECNLSRPDVYNAYKDYNEKQSGYRFICSNIELEYDNTIELKIISDDDCVYEKELSIQPADYDYTDRKVKLLSFSERLEDVILFHICQCLGDKQGFYVDVGANDPWKNSVTKTFSLKGWHGINIDPLRDKYEFLRFDRPNDLNINCGVYSAEGNMSLFCAGGRSTFDKNEWDVLRKEGFPEEIINVPVHTLDRIIEENISFINNEICFLKIDVEGLERDVLSGISLDKYRPFIITCEATLPGTGISCAEKYEDVLLENGYIMGFDDGVNRYYVREENKSDINCFVELDKLFELYEIYKPCEYNA